MPVEDFRVHVGFWDHPKTVKLIRRLDLAGPVALQKLWAWATNNRQLGGLHGLTDEDVEIAAGWTGASGALVAGLLEVGYLDRTPDGCLAIHDWAVRQPWIVDTPERTARAVHGGHKSHGVAFSKSCQICKASAGRRRMPRGSPTTGQRVAGSSPLLSLPIPSSPETGTPKPPASPPNDHTRLVDLFHAKYLARTGHPPTWGEKQGKWIKALLEKHPYAECERRVLIFFGPNRPKWPDGLDLGTLVAHFDKFATEVQAPTRDGPRANVNPNRYALPKPDPGGS